MRKVQPIRDERVIDGMKEYFYIRSMRNYLFFVWAYTADFEYLTCSNSRRGKLKGLISVWLSKKISMRRLLLSIRV